MTSTIQNLVTRLNLLSSRLKNLEQHYKKLADENEENFIDACSANLLISSASNCAEKLQSMPGRYDSAFIKKIVETAFDKRSINNKLGFDGIIEFLKKLNPLDALYGSRMLTHLLLETDYFIYVKGLSSDSILDDIYYMACGLCNKLPVKYRNKVHELLCLTSQYRWRSNSVLYEYWSTKCRCSESYTTCVRLPSGYPRQMYTLPRESI